MPHVWHGTSFAICGICKGIFNQLANRTVWIIPGRHLHKSECTIDLGDRSSSRPRFNNSSKAYHTLGNFHGRPRRACVSPHPQLHMHAWPLIHRNLQELLIKWRSFTDSRPRRRIGSQIWVDDCPGKYKEPCQYTLVSFSSFSSSHTATLLRRSLKSPM